MQHDGPVRTWRLVQVTVATLVTMLALSLLADAVREAVQGASLATAVLHVLWIASIATVGSLAGTALVFRRLYRRLLTELADAHAVRREPDADPVD